LGIKSGHQGINSPDQRTPRFGRDFNLHKPSARTTRARRARCRRKTTFSYPEGDPLTCRTPLRRRAPRERVREQRMAGAAADVKRFDEQPCSSRVCPAHRRARFGASSKPSPRVPRRRCSAYPRLLGARIERSVHRLDASASSPHQNLKARGTESSRTHC